MMTDEQRQAAFPVHIDLGRKESDMAMPLPAKKGGKASKPKVHFPQLYIDAVPGLEQLPKEGCMLVGFRRKRLSLEEDGDGKETAGCTLEIRHLCLPEGDAGEGGDLESAFREYEKGEAKTDDDDEDDE